MIQKKMSKRKSMGLFCFLFVCLSVIIVYCSSFGRKTDPSTDISIHHHSPPNHRPDQTKQNKTNITADKRRLRVFDLISFGKCCKLTFCSCSRAPTSQNELPSVVCTKTFRYVKVNGIK